MAINFEAANMAGYNNPKIEVFTLTLNNDSEIAEAPNQSVLSDCINRGSVPFLRITTTDHNTMYILPITYIQQQTNGPEFCFSTVTKGGTATSVAPSVTAVNYPSEGAPQLFVQDIPVGNI